MKVWIKHQLHAISLYNVARELSTQRPGLRITCWNAGYRLVGAGEGLPIPPTCFICLVDLSK